MGLLRELTLQLLQNTKHRLGFMQFIWDSDFLILYTRQCSSARDWTSHHFYQDNILLGWYILDRRVRWGVLCFLYLHCQSGLLLMILKSQMDWSIHPQHAFNLDFSFSFLNTCLTLCTDGMFALRQRHVDIVTQSWALGNNKITVPCTSSMCLCVCKILWLGCNEGVISVNKTLHKPCQVKMDTAQSQ